jgi:hypothetical protein
MDDKWGVLGPDVNIIHHSDNPGYAYMDGLTINHIKKKGEGERQGV